VPRILSEDEIQDFRTSLCEVAERLFADCGYEGVTLRAIAAELGCSPMTPYRYFDNKEAIFTAVRMAAFMRFGRIIEQAALEHRDPIARLRAFARAYMGFAMEQPQAYRIMFEIARETTIDEDMLARPETRDAVLCGWRPLVEVLTELHEAGRIEGDPLTLAHLAWSSMHGLVTLELSQKLLLGRDYDELVEPLMDFFLRGIGAPPDSSESGADA